MPILSYSLLFTARAYKVCGCQAWTWVGWQTWQTIAKSLLASPQADAIWSITPHGAPTTWFSTWNHRNQPQIWYWAIKDQSFIGWIASSIYWSPFIINKYFYRKESVQDHKYYQDVVLTGPLWKYRPFGKEWQDLLLQWLILQVQNQTSWTSAH